MSVVQNPSCTCNGNINLTISGAIQPITYTWSNSATTEDVQNLCSGNYLVTVTDGNGCRIDTSFTLSNPNSPSISSITSTAETTGSSNGTATVIASGGTQPFSYHWSNTVLIGNYGAYRRSLQRNSYRCKWMFCCWKCYCSEYWNIFHYSYRYSLFMR